MIQNHPVVEQSKFKPGDIERMQKMRWEWHRDIINCDGFVLGGFTIALAQYSILFGAYDIAIYKEDGTTMGEKLS